MMKTKYILITPVYNEEQFIEEVIKSVLGQTILPCKWIIVDDGSADRTLNIVKHYANRHDFITYLHLNREKIKSYYGRRVCAILAGYKKIKKLEYDFLGILDGDITLEPTYYEGLLSEFDRNPRLGITAGVYLYKSGGRCIKPVIDRLCTPGSNHVFRRQCYEEIGGYVPPKYGGSDSYLDIMARMHGWETRNFEKYLVIQHRTVGTGGGMSIYQARFRQGLAEYGVATHPLFMLAKSLRRAFVEKPYVLGSLIRLAGFLYGHWLRADRMLSQEAMDFVRREQISRLFSYISNR